MVRQQDDIGCNGQPLQLRLGGALRIREQQRRSARPEDTQRARPVTAFDPTAPGLAVLLNGGGGQKFLFLGATASAPAGQQPGLYTATVTLSVIYQ
jgi:hypothetical protein